MKPRRFKLLIESPNMKKGTIAEHNFGIEMYECIVGKSPAILLHPSLVEGRETVWQEITEPEKCEICGHPLPRSNEN